MKKSMTLNIKPPSSSLRGSGLKSTLSEVKQYAEQKGLPLYEGVD